MGGVVCGAGELEGACFYPSIGHGSHGVSVTLKSSPKPNATVDLPVETVF